MPLLLLPPPLVLLRPPLMKQPPLLVVDGGGDSSLLLLLLLPLFLLLLLAEAAVGPPDNHGPSPWVTPHHSAPHIGRALVRSSVDGVPQATAKILPDIRKLQQLGLPVHFGLGGVDEMLNRDAVLLYQHRRQIFEMRDKQNQGAYKAREEPHQNATIAISVRFMRHFETKISHPHPPP